MRLLVPAVGIFLILGGCSPSNAEPAATEGGQTSGSDLDVTDCDPDVYVPQCDGHGVLTCSAEGSLSRRGCGPDSVCAEGSEGAGCVWLPGDCDPDTTGMCTDPGGIRSCEDGFWSFRGCGSHERCHGDSAGAQCLDRDRIECEPGGFEARCEGTAIVRCGRYQLEEAVACDEGTTCRSTLSGPAACIEDTAESCEPGGFEARCEGDDGIACEDTGWTRRWSCQADEQCRDAGAGDHPWCVPIDAEPCDPDHFVPSCEGGVARSCTAFGYVVSEVVCPEDTACALDTSCLFTTGCDHEVAACIPDDAASCREPQDTFCDGDTLALCFAGRQLFVLDCPTACRQGPDGAECV